MKISFRKHILRYSSILTVISSTFLNVGSMKLMAGNPLNETKEACLIVEGKIKHKLGKADDKYKIELISAGEKIDSAFVTHNAKFSFDLRANKHYAVRISKEGFVSKLVSIYTDVPPNLEDLCFFSFETGMISEEEAKEFDPQMLDFPIAQVSFNKKREAFTHSVEYTKMIKQDLALSSKYIAPVEGFFNKKNKLPKTNSTSNGLCKN
jgi:hypothetical protein